jgi:hypothetical protein
MSASESGKNIFSLDEVKDIVGGVDFIAALTGLVAGSLSSLYKSLTGLPEKFPSLEVLKLMHDAQSSLNLLLNIDACGPSERYENVNERFWNYHGALTMYYFECIILAMHSALSAFTGHYTVAYTELRSALESAVTGAVFDLLALPQYRESAKVLISMRGFAYGGKEAPSFKELIEYLREKYGERRVERSSEILEAIDTELKYFNPKFSFISLLNQLESWKIIDDKTHEFIKGVYAALSEYVHRVRPLSTETAMRLLFNKDLFPLEPIPERLDAFLRDFVEINGLLFYLLLKTLWQDIQDPTYTKCLETERIGELVERVRELDKKGYEVWRRNLAEVEQLLKLAASAGAQRTLA